ncbi:MAG TPA: flagellar hook-basal body protein [Bacillus bacterium]|uniref:Flagellar hook-basal body complex protein FlhO n=1 Tax=Siminovitchia fordii TaxID=254759 RepID=A0ABQ4K560_9BACI|nr:flagellar hook-basal body protein [Siminovitchia fordii]GIN20327.1 flagellar hook-basal body complex protein FlhO [Siminovitchia fordii]HBZ08250.1 flagellar hook-basal body protein [Bacillus sp. (in: firmicutes)]
MLRGLFTAASGMYASQRKTEMLTNNMANAQTPGFKADHSNVRAFPEMLIERFNAGKSRSERVGTLHTGVYVQEMLPRFVQGDSIQTERPTDFALFDRAEGTAFFSVEQDGQVKYTRNGRFTVDPSGTITTENGWPVLDMNGNQIRVTSDRFEVDESGWITENGIQIARFGIVRADNPENLAKEGDGLFRTENNAALPIAENVDFTISQGFVEKSNVDMSRSMTDMITAYRTFEANQKVVQAYDRSLDKAVNEVGRVNG